MTGKHLRTDSTDFHTDCIISSISVLFLVLFLIFSAFFASVWQVKLAGYYSSQLLGARIQRHWSVALPA